MYELQLVVALLSLTKARYNSICADTVGIIEKIYGIGLAMCNVMRSGLHVHV